MWNAEALPLRESGVRNGNPETRGQTAQQVLNPTPLNPAPATCHKRKRKLRCSFRNAALQKLHCNIGFSAVRKSFGPKAALQQTENCTATSKKLRCRKVALSCRFRAGFKPPRLGTHVSDLLKCSDDDIFGVQHVEMWRNRYVAKRGGVTAALLHVTCAMVRVRSTAKILHCL